MKEEAYQMLQPHNAIDTAPPGGDSTIRTRGSHSVLAVLGVIGGLAFAAAMFASPSAAAEFPAKPITVVVHAGPGSGADLFAREVANRLSPILGQSVVVRNMPGGSSAIAMQYVASQPPDGYTLIKMTDTNIITPIKHKTPKSVKDLTPVANLLLDPNVLFVRSDNKYSTIKAMLDDLKSGTRLRWAAIQAGSPETMAVEGLIKRYKLTNIVPVPFDEGPAGVLAVLGGHIVASVAEPAEIAAQIEAKQVRVLATFTSKRMPRMPDVPTFDELGYKVAIDKFRGFAAPKGTPRPVIAVLEKALKQVLEKPDYKAVYDRNFQIPNFMSAAEFGRFLAQKQATYEAAFGSK